VDDAHLDADVLIEEAAMTFRKLEIAGQRPGQVIDDKASVVGLDVEVVGDSPDLVVPPAAAEGE
jgi:hypothetical protein